MTGANDTNDCVWMGLILKREASYFRAHRRHALNSPGRWWWWPMSPLEVDQNERTKGTLNADNATWFNQHFRSELHFPSIGLIDFFFELFLVCVNPDYRRLLGLVFMVAWSIHGSPSQYCRLNKLLFLLHENIHTEISRRFWTLRRPIRGDGD